MYFSLFAYIVAASFNCLMIFTKEKKYLACFGNIKLVKYPCSLVASFLITRQDFQASSLLRNSCWKVYFQCLNHVSNLFLGRSGNPNCSCYLVGWSIQTFYSHICCHANCLWKCCVREIISCVCELSNCSCSWCNIFQIFNRDCHVVFFR